MASLPKFSFQAPYVVTLLSEEPWKFHDIQYFLIVHKSILTVGTEKVILSSHAISLCVF